VTRPALDRPFLSLDLRPLTAEWIAAALAAPALAAALAAEAEAWEVVRPAAQIAASLSRDALASNSYGWASGVAGMVDRLRAAFPDLGECPESRTWTDAARALFGAMAELEAALDSAPPWDSNPLQDERRIRATDRVRRALSALSAARRRDAPEIARDLDRLERHSARVPVWTPSSLDRAAAARRAAMIGRAAEARDLETGQAFVRVPWRVRAAEARIHLSAARTARRMNPRRLP
jgi:hypothetical protein